MTEIRPWFIETDFRDFHEKSYQELHASLEKKIDDRKPILIFLGITALLSFSLLFFDERWFNFGLIPLTGLVAIVCWNALLKYDVKSVIHESRIRIDEYILGTARTHKIKYIYNDIVIEYYEGDDLKYTFFWSDLKHVEYCEECFILRFGIEKPYITMFRSMNNNDELKWFETEVIKNVMRINEKK